MLKYAHYVAGGVGVAILGGELLVEIDFFISGVDFVLRMRYLESPGSTLLRWNPNPLQVNWARAPCYLSVGSDS